MQRDIDRPRDGYPSRLLVRVGLACAAIAALSAGQCASDVWPGEEQTLDDDVPSERAEFRYPRVVLDGNGQAMVLAEEVQRRGAATRSVGLIARRYDFAAREFVETATLVDAQGNPRTSGDGTAAIAMDASGQAVAWRPCRLCFDGYVAFVARYVPGGGWSAGQEVDVSSSGQLVMDGNGHALLGGTFAAFRIVPVHSTGALGRALDIEAYQEEDGKPGFGVAYWSDGIGYVAWTTDDGALMARRFVRSSATWEPVEHIAAAQQPSDVKIAHRSSAPSAGAMLAWRTAEGIFASRYVPGAGWSAASLVPGTNGAAAYDIAMAANGDVLVVWSWDGSGAQSGSGPLGSTRWSAGTWARVDVTAGGLTSTGGPIRLAGDAAGNGVLLVTPPLDIVANRARVWSARYDSGGVWSRLQPIGDAVVRSGGEHVFDVAMDDSGRALAVWETLAAPSLGGTRVAVHEFGRPVARFTHSPLQPVAEGLTRFDASTSSDDDGAIVAYDWDFDNDGMFDRIGVAPEVTFPAAGTYTVRLRVTDDSGDTDEIRQTVTVLPPPVVEPSRNYTLRITVARTGGFVGSTDGTFSCGTSGAATCSVEYAAGAVVSIYADRLPGANVLFEGWAGDCAGGPSLTLTMNRDYTCTAVFASGPLPGP